MRRQARARGIPRAGSAGPRRRPAADAERWDELENLLDVSCNLLRHPLIAHRRSSGSQLHLRASSISEAASPSASYRISAPRQPGTASMLSAAARALLGTPPK